MSERRLERRILVAIMVMTVATTASTGVDDDRKHESSWVMVCAGDSEVDSSYRTTYESPTGARTTLLVSASQPAAAADCASVRLPVAASAIVWARLVPAATMKRLAAGFLLQGGVSGSPSANSEIIPLDEPDSPAPALPTTNPTGAARVEAARSTWAWRPELWRKSSEALLARAKAWQVDTIYITVPTTPTGEVIAADELRQFLHEAARRGVHVWAVDGDPRAVLPSERASFEARARAYAAFNADTKGPRLAGIQYDIEPYLVAGYHLDEEGWKDAYAATIAGLARAAAGLPIELAVPFWWLDANSGSSGAAFVDRLAPSIASIAIMDYRTDAAMIERFARPWLEWGARHRKRIRVALEAGPIPDEPRYHFRPARAGTLWQVSIGSQHILLLLNAPAANPAWQSFARIGQSMSSGATQTFHGSLDKLRAMLPQLERTFAAYAAFGGIALHEVPDTPDTPDVPEPDR